MEAIYSHIEKRIKALGYSQFHLQPTMINTSSGQLHYELQAYNELYFLMGQVPPGTRIVSDSEAMLVDEVFNQSAIRPFYEFSGLIEITLPESSPNSIEFLRVIPE